MGIKSQRIQLGLVKVLISTIIVIFFLCLGISSWADDQEAKYSFFFGPLVSYNSLGGDFNGSNIILAKDATATTSAVPLVILPSIQNSIAYGFVLGVKTGQVSLEASYSYSSHDVNSFLHGNSYSRKADYRIISLDGKYYLSPDSRIQPFFQFGLAFPWLTLNSNPQMDPNAIYNLQATFYGFGLDVGGGISANISPIMINLSVFLRSVVFTDVKALNPNPNSPVANAGYTTYSPFTGYNIIPSLSVCYVF